MPRQTTNWNQLYRPRRISDLHLDSVRAQLTALLAAKHFPQALLFAGPKGTGKTSVARIIGALLNDPANEKAVDERFFNFPVKTVTPLVEPDPNRPEAQSIYTGQSFLVQEQDAASNRGIDDVRALKERSALPPAQGKIAVYILDEVHMLTIEAFNALLKLLEEPPAHAVFILATTEIHKVPATIVSRCQLVQFHKASADEQLVALRRIAQQENEAISEESLQAIIRAADGSFRDSVKLLQQTIANGISEEPTGLQLLSEQTLITLVSAVIQKDPVAVSAQLAKLRAAGVDELATLRSLIQFLHADLLIHLGVSEGKAHLDERVDRFLLNRLADPVLAQPSPIPFLRLELALLELIDRARAKTAVPPSNGSGSSTSSSKATTVVSPLSKQHSPTKETLAATATILVEPNRPIESSAIETAVASLDASDTVPSNGETEIDSTLSLTSNRALGDGQQLCAHWSEVVTKALQYNFALSALLRSAQPIDGGEGTLVLRVYYNFHREQLLEKKWLKFWDDVSAEYAGGTVSIDCVVEKLNPNDLQQVTNPASTANLETLAVEALMS